MKGISTELKVGIFAIVVLLALSFMTFKVGGLGAGWKKGYRLYLSFDNISGLEEKTKVKVAGVDAGIVERIVLTEGRARLIVLLKPEIEIHRDTKASIRVAGLLGDKYLALSSGTSSEPLLTDGEAIKNTESALDIDALAQKLTSAAGYISDLAETLTGTFGASEKEAIQESIRNLREITKNFNEILKEDREPLNRTITKLENFSNSLSDKGPGLVDDMREIAKELKEAIKENRYAFKDSVDNIKSFAASADKLAQNIDKGEGTLGKLFKDDKLYNSINKFADNANKFAESAGKGMETVTNLKTFMNFRSEYLLHEGEAKGYFDLILEKDTIKLSVDVWDFSADEAKADKAHAKIGLDYKIFKHLFITTGIDNLLNENYMGIYVGGGLQFEDEDFKYIFGGGGAPKLPGK
ncbi:MAG: MCE family protein [Nitrospirae bacterium]|nr:MCE family protein [Nitrospirota bacterium]